MPWTSLLTLGTQCIRRRYVLNKELVAPPIVLGTRAEKDPSTLCVLGPGVDGPINLLHSTVWTYFTYFSHSVISHLPAVSRGGSDVPIIHDLFANLSGEETSEPVDVWLHAEVYDSGHVCGWADIGTHEVFRIRPHGN